MFKFILTLLSLGTLLVATPAVADTYRGTFEIVEVEKEKLKLQGVRKGDTFTAQFEYSPFFQDYIINGPHKPWEELPRHELFSKDLNNVIHSISLEQFSNYHSPLSPATNPFKHNQDGIMIRNHIGIPGIWMNWNELLQLDDAGVRKKAALRLYTPLFTQDQALISNLTLLNGHWGEENILTLTVEDITSKPKRVIIHGALRSLECIAGSCLPPAQTKQPKQPVAPKQDVPPAPNPQKEGELPPFTLNKPEK